MFKKSLIRIGIIMIIVILSFHFYLNFQLRTSPPSKEWSKEVLLYEGSIQCNPRLIKYKDSYITVFGDGKNVKILRVDSIGRKVEEKALPVKEGTLKDIHMLTDDKNLFLEMEIYKDKSSQLLTLEGDEKLDFKEESTISNIGDFVQLDRSAIAVAVQDNIEFIDFKNNTRLTIPISKQRFLMGARHKDEYIISYMKGLNQFEYIRIKDGKASSPKIGGYYAETTKVTFLKGTMMISDDYAHVFIEYKFEDDYSGSKLLTFSLNTEKSETGPFRVNGKDVEISNVEPYYNNGETAILATSERVFGKKKSFEDIVKFDAKGGTFVKATPLSRSKEISLYASSAGDTITYCDIVSNDKLKLYMISSREDFKKANSAIRNSEVKAALNDTIESCTSSTAYLIFYGVFWIIPCISLTALIFMFEYKLQTKGKKVLFILLSILATIIKCRYIYKTSFVTYAYLLPKFLTPVLGLGICILISIVFYIPAYKDYTNENEDKPIIVPFSISLFFESLFTVMFLCSFLV